MNQEKKNTAKKRCLCDICVRISPMQKCISDALPEELRIDFAYLMTRMECAEMDLDAAQAKLDGEWPGWEWIKDARTAAEFHD